MDRQSSITSGVVLIFVGVLFLTIQFFDLQAILNFATLWPFIMLGIGVVFLIAAVGSTPPLAIPGTILTGIGVLALYKNSFDAWDQWQLWLLVNAFVGLGLLLHSLLDGRGVTGAMPAAGILIGIGVGVYLILTLAALWPVILIAVGAVLLFSNLSQRRTPKAE